MREGDTHSDENNGQEDESTEESDEVIFENRNIHLTLDENENTNFPNREDIFEKNVNTDNHHQGENFQNGKFNLNEDETTDNPTEKDNFKSHNIHFNLNENTDNPMEEDNFKSHNIHFNLNENTDNPTREDNFESRNVHLNLNEDENAGDTHEVNIENKDIENVSPIKDNIGENNIKRVEIIPDIKEGNDGESSCDKITDISENSDLSRKSEKSIIQYKSKIESDDDSLSDKITDLSEKSDEDTNQDNAGNINALNSTDTSLGDSSTSNDSRNNFRKKRKKISEQLKITNSRLKEEIGKCEVCFFIYIISLIMSNIFQKLFSKFIIYLVDFIYSTILHTSTVVLLSTSMEIPITCLRYFNLWICTTTFYCHQYESKSKFCRGM